MAVFTITTFSTFAGLLLAGRKLATTPDPVSWLKALADLATNGEALAAVLADTGLTPLAAEMARQAENHARHFTHPGAARDDAIAIFWQVAPEAFADPRAFAAGDLDPDRITERMVAAINASPHARDFAATALAAPFFRSVTRRTLAVMLGKADYIATITPDLWRETLRRHGIEIALLERIDAKTDTQLAQLARMEVMLQRLGAAPPGVPEATVIELARRVAPRTDDIDEALGELRRAVDLVAEMQARGKAYRNVDASVGGVLRRLEELTDAGKLAEAAAAADDAVVQAEAGMVQLLDAAANQHLLTFDAEGAARHIARKAVVMAAGGKSGFDAVMDEQTARWQLAVATGSRLDAEVTVALAREALALAPAGLPRGEALNVLGTSLRALGERERDPDRLRTAADTLRQALDERTREKSPPDWAMTQMNLGNALSLLGELTGNDADYAAALAAYDAALEVRALAAGVVPWARAMANRGSTRAALAELSHDPDMVKAAIEDFDAVIAATSDLPAVREIPAQTRTMRGACFARLAEREAPEFWARRALEDYQEAIELWKSLGRPFDMARTWENAGEALRTLATVERPKLYLAKAVASYEAALSILTPDHHPYNWTKAKVGLGDTLRLLGEFERSRERLVLAVSVLDEGVSCFPTDIQPQDNAIARLNLAIARRALAAATGDAALARQARDAIAAMDAAALRGDPGPDTATIAPHRVEAEALVARLEGG